MTIQLLALAGFNTQMLHHTPVKPKRNYYNIHFFYRSRFGCHYSFQPPGNLAALWKPFLQSPKRTFIFFSNSNVELHSICAKK